MPIIGLDLVIRCKSCESVARVRLDEGASLEDFATAARVFAELANQGFEPEGDDWLCWQHGKGQRVRGSPPMMKAEKDRS